MKKSILNFGKTLNPSQLKQITGGCSFSIYERHEPEDAEYCESVLADGAVRRLISRYGTR
ncbi:hypothetical protein ABW636_04390 [Aquimarina sp. 2201CG1-2-11]|uniref:hypothetical protein n=1 Tax=Aquimarina discodermiae TaxID=3231043 RepID=UPI003462B1BE